MNDHDPETFEQVKAERDMYREMMNRVMHAVYPMTEEDLKDWKPDPNSIPFDEVLRQIEPILRQDPNYRRPENWGV